MMRRIMKILTMNSGDQEDYDDIDDNDDLMSTYRQFVLK